MKLQKHSTQSSEGSGKPHESPELDRLSRRLEAHRAQIRSRIEAADPELLAALAALKKTFKAQLRFVRIGDWSQGTEPERGVIVNVRENPKRRRTNSKRN